MASNIEVEASRFARTVEEIEKLMRDGGQPGQGYPLAAMLGSAQARLDSLRAEEEHVTTEKREKEQKDQSAIAAMVERETKLNEEEKKKYAEFLSKDYFTKSDFRDLSQFYSDGGSYDRLSEEGKAQMDHRVREGIRQGKFSRDELPDEVEKRTFKSEDRSQIRGQSSSNVRAAEATSVAHANRDSEIKAEFGGQETSDSDQKTKTSMPEGLAALANLSPVQETDTVSVPQTGKDSSSRQVGG